MALVLMCWVCILRRFLHGSDYSIFESYHFIAQRYVGAHLFLNLFS